MAIDSRARSQALANIQAHLEYLERTIDRVNHEIEQLNQNDRQPIDKINLVKPGIIPI